MKGLSCSVQETAADMAKRGPFKRLFNIINAVKELEAEPKEEEEPQKKSPEGQMLILNFITLSQHYVRAILLLIVSCDHFSIGHYLLSFVGVFTALRTHFLKSFSPFSHTHETNQELIKCDIGEFYERHLSTFHFYLHQTVLRTTLHKGINMDFTYLDRHSYSINFKTI
jgi:hypothetical protein